MKPNLNNTKWLPMGFQGKYFSTQILSGREHLKPNQITPRCFPEVFMKNISLLKYYQMENPTAAQGRSQQVYSVISFLSTGFCCPHYTVRVGHVTISRRKQTHKLRRPGIKNTFPPSLQQVISSKANQLLHHNVRFLRLHSRRSNTMEWPRARSAQLGSTSSSEQRYLSLSSLFRQIKLSSTLWYCYAM